MVSGRHSHRSARWPLLRLGLGGAGLAVAAIVVVIGIGQVAGGRACAAAVSAVSGVSGVSGSGAVAGTATHYVLSGTGNCSYPSAPAGGLYVALSPPEYDGAAACGGYLEVSGPDGSVSVEVIDQCPPCASGHIDLSEAAFSRIAPLAAGLVSVTYRSVTDPPLPAPVSLLVKEGSSQYWLALLAMNTGNPLALVQVETASGGWRDLARADYNYWLASSGAGPGPFTVRLTDTDGHQITVHGVTLDPGVIQDTGTFMYGAGTVTAPAPTPGAAAVTTAGVPASSEPARRQRAPVPAARSATARPAAPRVPAPVPAMQSHAQRSPSAAPSC
jgi:expansin (peptidoglycan-binding protein)